MLRWWGTGTWETHRHLPGVPARQESLASPAKNHITVRGHEETQRPHTAPPAPKGCSSFPMCGTQPGHLGRAGTGRGPQIPGPEWGEGGEQGINAPAGAGGGWCETTGAPPVPACISPPCPHSPASPQGLPALSHPGGPGAKDGDRGGVSARQGQGQCQAGEQCGTHRAAVPALLVRFPSVTPQATFTLQWGQAWGHRIGRDLSMTSPGLSTPKDGCAQQYPGLCSLLTWEIYDLRPCLLWVLAHPQLQAHPVLGRRQMPSALAAPVPHHHPQPQPMLLAQLSCLGCLLLSDQPHTLAPLGPMGPRSPGRPIRLPSTTSTCGQGTVRASTQGTSGRIPQGQSPPRALSQGTGCGHPSPEGRAGTLTMVPSSSHHLPWALGALGVQASHPFPEKGRETG